MKNFKLDINCDLGEHDDYVLGGKDEKLMHFISSCNIACGYHAGNELTMKKTISTAIKNHVLIGAHPSYPGRNNFGRTKMTLAEEDLKSMLTDQILLLKNLVESEGEKLNHVKAHGSLYHDVCFNKKLANVFVDCIATIDEDLIVYGFSKSPLAKISHAYKLKFYHEGFADRRYSAEGLLIPRSQEGALIEEAEHITDHLDWLLKHDQGLDTICIHGDAPHAVEVAKATNSFINS